MDGRTQEEQKIQDLEAYGTQVSCEDAFKSFCLVAKGTLSADPDQLRIAFNSGFVAAMNRIIRDEAIQRQAARRPWYARFFRQN
jgi:hypothetical protein